MKKKSRKNPILQTGTTMTCLLPLLCLACMFFESDTLSKTVFLYCVQCSGFLLFLLLNRRKNQNRPIPLMAVLTSIIFCILFLYQKIIDGNYQNYIINNLGDILDYPISFCLKLTILLVLFIGSIRKYNKTRNHLPLCLIIPASMFLLIFYPYDLLTLSFCALSIILSVLSIVIPDKSPTSIV